MIELANRKERINRRGWLTHETKLIKLAEEWRGVRWGKSVIYLQNAGMKQTNQHPMQCGGDGRYRRSMETMKGRARHQFQAD